MTGWYLALVGLLAVMLAAPALGRVPGRVLRVMGIYLAIAYAGRAVFLLAFDPRPGPGTFIADGLLRTPTYQAGLAQLAPIATLGVAGILAGFYAVALGPRRAQSRSTPRRGWRQSGAAIALCGWPVRAMTLVLESDRQEGLLGRLSVLPTVAAGLVILGTNWRATGKGRHLVLLLALGEAVWSVSADTKTPILVVAAFLFLDPNRKRITWRTGLAVTAAALLAFVVIQPTKTDIASSDHGGVSALAPIGRVLVRFDLLRALTVAERAGAGSYMGTSEISDRALGAWLPDSIVETNESPSAVAWGERMNGSESGAYLAEGPIAEGFALFGMAGALLWSLVAGAVAALVAMAIRQPRNYGTFILAVSLVASNAIFERGLLGVNENIAVGIQVVVLALVPYILIRRTLTPEPAPPSIGSRWAGVSG